MVSVNWQVVLVSTPVVKRYQYQAEAKWQANLEASVSALEGLIDIAIRGALGVPVRVETHTYDPKAVSLVAAKYEANGWLVKAGNDQRDGPWLTLE